MALFRISNAAIADMLAIGRYTEQIWGVEQRNLYLGRLDKAIRNLAKKPKLGQGCDDIRPGYRKYPEGKHSIFYRISDDNCVEIIRILHQHMEPSNQL